MAALTLPTPQYSTGIPAASNTPADSARKATTTSVSGNSSINDSSLIVDGRTQAQCPPRIVHDDIQIHQSHQCFDLVSRKLTEVGSRRHRAAGREDIIDQHQASLAALHFQHAGSVLQLV